MCEAEKVMIHDDGRGRGDIDTRLGAIEVLFPHGMGGWVVLLAWLSAWFIHNQTCYN